MGHTTRSLSHNIGMITELSTFTQNVYIFVSKTHDNNNENVKEIANSENYYTSFTFSWQQQWKCKRNC